MNLGRIAGLSAAAIGIGGGGIALSRNHSRAEDDARRTSQDNMSGKAIRCRANGDSYVPAHREWPGKWVPGVCVNR
jgi:hypothetical protein